MPNDRLLRLFSIFFIFFLLSVTVAADSVEPAPGFRIPQTINIITPRQNEILAPNPLLKWSGPRQQQTFVITITDRESLQTVLEDETPTFSYQLNSKRIESGKTYGIRIQAVKDQKTVGISNYVSFTLIDYIETFDFEKHSDAAFVKGEKAEDGKESLFSKIFISRVGRMSIAEKVGWWTAKNILVPSLSMAVTTSIGIAFPPAGVIAGQMVVGAATSGILSYLSDKRTNQLGLTDKSEEEIRFDALVTAISRMGSLPISMICGGIGSSGVIMATQSVFGNALMQGGFQVLSSAASSGLSGIARHYLAHGYLQIDSKIKVLEDEMFVILKKYDGKGFEDISEADRARLSELEAEIQKWKSKDYNWKNFFEEDLKKAAVSGLLSGWGGALPTAVKNSFSTSPLPVKLSMKLFGGTGHSSQIAEMLTMHPFTFMSGYLNAHIDINAKNLDLQNLIDKQKTFPRNSAEWKYYNLQILRLEQEIDSIKPVQQGVSEMTTLAIVKGGNLAFQLGKTRLIDLPRQRQAEIDRQYKESAEHWIRTDELRNRYQALKDNPPQRSQFRNVSDYLAAKGRYDSALQSARENFEVSAVQSMYKDKEPRFVELKNSIGKEYDFETKVNRNIELAKALGKQEYLKEMVKVMKKNPDYSGKSVQQLEKIATDRLNTYYTQSCQLLQQEYDSMNTTLDRMNKLRNNFEEFSNEEIRSIVSSQSVITPSAYRAKYVELKVNELRSKGISDQNIRAYHYNDILKQAQQKTFYAFGSNNANVLRSEIIGNMLINAKYSPDNSVTLQQKIQSKISEIPSMATNNFSSEYSKRFNEDLTDAIFNNNMASLGHLVPNNIIQDIVSDIFE